MRGIVVPPAPGLFSAFGLLYAEVEHHYARTFRRLLRKVDLAALERAWDAMATQARAQLEAEGFRPRPRCASGGARACTTRARPSISTVPVPDGALDRAALAGSRRRSGGSTSAPTAIAPAPTSRSSWSPIRVTGRALAKRAPVRRSGRRGAARPRRAAPRLAYFGPEAGWLETPVLRRAELATPREGRASSRSTTRLASCRRRARLARCGTATSSSSYRSPVAMEGERSIVSDSARPARRGPACGRHPGALRRPRHSRCQHRAYRGHVPQARHRLAAAHQGDQGARPGAPPAWCGRERHHLREARRSRSHGRGRHRRHPDRQPDRRRGKRSRAWWRCAGAPT